MLEQKIKEENLTIIPTEEKLQEILSIKETIGCMDISLPMPGVKSLCHKLKKPYLLIREHGKYNSNPRDINWLSHFAMGLGKDNCGIKISKKGYGEIDKAATLVAVGRDNKDFFKNLTGHAFSENDASNFEAAKNYLINTHYTFSYGHSIYHFAQLIALHTLRHLIMTEQNSNQSQVINLDFHISRGFLCQSLTTYIEEILKEQDITTKQESLGILSIEKKGQVVAKVRIFDNFIRSVSLCSLKILGHRVP